jgi:hypothetical protein
VQTNERCWAVWGVEELYLGSHFFSIKQLIPLLYLSS